MTFLDVINPGDKIDIHLEDKKLSKNSDGDQEMLYKSNVTDMISGEEIEISMPIESGRMVVFHSGQQLDMIFYSKRGLFRCTATVSNRYKRDNLFLLTVKAKSELKKFQRREFFRMDCSLDMNYYIISDGVAAAATTNELIGATQEMAVLKTLNKGTALDISGGGLRFSSPEKLNVGSYILTTFQLDNSKVQAEFYLVGYIISSESSQNDSRKYMNRIKFIYKDLKDRESIVQFVFEEERRMRKRENG